MLSKLSPESFSELVKKELVNSLQFPDAARVEVFVNKTKRKEEPNQSFHASIMVQGHERGFISAYYDKPGLQLLPEEHKLIQSIARLASLWLQEFETEKHNYKLALEESEKKYRELFEHASDAIIILSGDKIIDCNQRAAVLFRGLKDDLLGLTPRELSPDIQPDGNSSATKAMRLIQLSGKGKPVRFEWQHKTLDGQLFDAEISLQKLVLQNESFLLSIVRDVSDRKKAEKELASEKHFFEQMFLQSTISTQILDKDGWCISINPKLSQLFGVKPEDIEGRKYNILKDQEVIDKGVIKHLEKVFSKLRPASWEVHFDIGAAASSQQIKVSSPVLKWFRNWAFPITDREGILQYVVIQHMDITEEKEKVLAQDIFYQIASASITTKNLEDLLARVRSELGRLIDTTNFFAALYEEETGMLSIPFIKDDKEITDCLPARGSLSGLVIEKKQTLLLKKEDIHKLIGDGLINATGEVSEVWLGTPLLVDKKVFGVIAVQHYENPNAYDAKSVAMFEFVGSQISLAIQRKQHTDQLREAKTRAEQSDRLKTAFLNNLSHEIRTPLNAIMGFSEVLCDGNLADDKMRHITTIIRQSGLQLMSVIDDIIDMSSIESGMMEADMEETNLNNILELLFHQFTPQAKEKSVELVLQKKLPAHEASIITDKTKVTQVLTNLLQNALKFTETGIIAYGCKREKNQLMFYVKDTGIGIAKEDQQKIFDRFTQIETMPAGQRSGVGLGLSISRSFVELLGGRIWVDSSPGQGSEFHFALPWIPAKWSATHQEQADPIQKDIAGMRILVAEDEILNYELVREILSMHGFVTLHAVNGEEAVSIVQERQDISMVLMDIKMPVLDGLEASRLIKAIKPDLPIVALTAHVLQGDREKTLEAGCDDYLTKPVSRKILIDCIEKYTGKSSS